MEIKFKPKGREKHRVQSTYLYSQARTFQAKNLENPMQVNINEQYKRHCESNERRSRSLTTVENFNSGIAFLN